jgi:hypothetical protein
MQRAFSHAGQVSEILPDPLPLCVGESLEGLEAESLTSCTESRASITKPRLESWVARTERISAACFRIPFLCCAGHLPYSDSSDSERIWTDSRWFERSSVRRIGDSPETGRDSRASADSVSWRPGEGRV